MFYAINNWCVSCASCISDSMVKHKKIDTFFKRKVSDKNGNCIASTSTVERNS